MNSSAKRLLAALMIVGLLSLSRAARTWQTNQASLSASHGTFTPQDSRGDSSITNEESDRAAAVAFLEHYTQQHPDQLISAYQLGQFYLDQGRRAAAVTQWQQVAGAEIRLASLALEQLERGKMDQATYYADLSHAVAPRPTSARIDLYRSLCDAWRAADSLTTSLLWCRLASDILHNGWTQAAYARLLIQDEQYDLAESVLTTGLGYKNDAAFGTLYQTLAGLYLRQARLELAEQAYQLALESGHDNQWVYFGLADVAQLSEKTDRACKFLSLAIEKGHNLTTGDRMRFSDCPDLPP